MDLLPHEAENNDFSMLSRKYGCRFHGGKLDKTVNKKVGVRRSVQRHGVCVLTRLAC